MWLIAIRLAWLERVIDPGLAHCGDVFLGHPFRRSGRGDRLYRLEVRGSKCAVRFEFRDVGQIAVKVEVKSLSLLAVMAWRRFFAFVRESSTYRLIIPLGGIGASSRFTNALDGCWVNPSDPPLSSRSRFSAIYAHAESRHQAAAGGTQRL